MADRDFVVKNGLVVNTNLIFANGTSKFVGINNSAPDAELTVTGSAKVSGNFDLGASLAVSGGITTSSNVAVGANVLVNTSVFLMGNSTVNSVQNSTVFAVSNSSTSSNLTSSDLKIGVSVVNTSTVAVGANARINASALYIGNSTANVVANSTSIFVGNSTVNVLANSSTIVFNNSSVVNSTSFSGTSNNSTNFDGQPQSYYTNAENISSGTLSNSRLPSQVVNTSGNFTLSGNIVFSGENTAISSNVNIVGGFLNVASAFVVNSTGAYHTGTVNAASHSVGANIVANSTGIIFVGNTTKPTVAITNAGSILIGNSTTNTTAILISVANDSVSSNISPAGFFGNGYNLSINAVKIDSGTLPSARISGSYTGITAVGTLNSLAASGNSNFDSGVLFVDGTNNRVGINNTSPDTDLTVTGSASVSGNLSVSGSLIVTGNTVSAGTTEYSGNLVPLSNGYNLGITTKRWILVATDGNFSGNVSISSNLLINTTSISYVGNTTTSPTITVANTGAVTIGNSSTTQTTSVISIANSVGSANVSPAGFSGNGFNITSINATSITNGVLPSARISGSYTGITAVGNLTGLTVASGNINFDSGILFVDGTNNRVGVNTTSPSVSLQISSNDAIIVPIGTTAQRPTGSNGMFRYNSNTDIFEGYSGGSWKPIAESGGYYKGNNGTAGNTVNKANLFRINANTQSNNITISAGENAMAAGPLTVASGFTLTVETGGRVVIV